jgi:hypothetical protein
MDRWGGFGYVVFASIAFPFLPFIIALFGRYLPWKGCALGLGLATLSSSAMKRSCFCAG